jgi:hypothetical protein
MNTISQDQWIKASEQKPDENKAVEVFIPEEDNHVTVGMWDVSKKWVLLDEYRVPVSEVTYWRYLRPEPDDKTYTPTERTLDDETMSRTIRVLQKQLFELEQRYRIAEYALRDIDMAADVADPPFTAGGIACIARVALKKL